LFSFCRLDELKELNLLLGSLFQSLPKTFWIIPLRSINIPTAKPMANMATLPVAQDTKVF